ncbi:MAG TPA: hypothetical protein PKD83_01425 [Ignavibacteria bacterium]|nr:hypothetical protein [Ignavibacteria bacterium]
MTEKSKSNLYFYSSLILAIWFLLTCYLWTYYINIVFSFPAGFLSLYLLFKGRKTGYEYNRFKLVSIILISGIIITLVSLVMILVIN